MSPNLPIRPRGFHFVRRQSQNAAAVALLLQENSTSCCSVVAFASISLSKSFRVIICPASFSPSHQKKLFIHKLFLYIPVREVYLYLKVISPHIVLTFRRGKMPFFVLSVSFQTAKHTILLAFPFIPFLLQFNTYINVGTHTYVYNFLMLVEEGSIIFLWMFPFPVL